MLATVVSCRLTCLLPELPANLHGRLHVPKQHVDATPQNTHVARGCHRARRAGRRGSLAIENYDQNGSG